MKKIILSNLLKIKNTSIQKLVFIFPMFCIVLALLFSSLGGESILRLVAETTLNQWGIIWINLIIAVVSGLLNKLEMDSNKYLIFLSRNIDLKQVEYARIILIALISLAVSVVLGIILILVSFVIPTPSITSLFKLMLTILLIWVTTLWQIPFTLWLSRKTSLYFSVIVNVFAPLLIGTSFSLLEKWYLFPYDWSLKLLEPMTRMRINGIPFDSDFIPDYSLITISLGLSIILFSILTELAAISFKRQVR
ncbi:lantibiotic immunity ABC transporter MutE/EpiE family permease subunit [Streptococcus suis]|uniref:lantibiotic immunity ABC transporter MutE/EpiE family permease subunit n=1 Tax=Streptococcus TaxID=1301 RepID=UPI000F62F898|nr:lantibiotic immunity ABC transporter MutE/EpiE family permease subunit [Streptococcus suis]RRR54959.1 lantibiotic immunity ABC transporter MutE/EpiE family permease subunit [Streptococcus suis]HEL1796075.1 lantibiotic immunity ABC transporter MutE/EpiE family permease subunit [Streptococcus suis]HEL1797559.1 lantibiotic immunity ABC transporter MutE/EpiE family permease subunit [Streptococcus suis]